MQTAVAPDVRESVRYKHEDSKLFSADVLASRLGVDSASAVADEVDIASGSKGGTVRTTTDAGGNEYVEIYERLESGDADPTAVPTRVDGRDCTFTTSAADSKSVYERIFGSSSSKAVTREQDNNSGIFETAETSSSVAKAPVRKYKSDNSAFVDENLSSVGSLGKFLATPS